MKPRYTVADEGQIHYTAHLDEGEFLEVEYFTLDRLYEMVMSGEITDAKTQIAILKAREILKNR